MLVLSTALAVAGLIGLTVVSLAIVVDVLLRFFFGTPMTGMWDLVGLVSAVSVTAFFPLSLLSRSHLSIRPFGNILAPGALRILDFFAAVVTMIFFGVVTWQLFRYAGNSLAYNEVTPILRVRLAEFWFAAAALMTIAALAAAYMILRTANGDVSQSGKGTPE